MQVRDLDRAARGVVSYWLRYRLVDTTTELTTASPVGPEVVVVVVVRKAFIGSSTYEFCQVLISTLYLTGIFRKDLNSIHQFRDILPFSSCSVSNMNNDFKLFGTGSR